ALEMLEALANEDYRNRVLKALPPIVTQEVPVGPLSESLCDEFGITSAPLIFPPSDDQAAGLIGAGAVDDGHLAIILGNSAVVNSSSNRMPTHGNLDVMRLNWGPYLWMRCYNNGAQFVDGLLGEKPDWATLEQAGRAVPAGCNGVRVRPFLHPEPSLGVAEPWLAWSPQEPSEPGVRYRAGLEALAFLIARAVREHEQAGQTITRITVSGGLAKSNLMLEILASVLNRSLDRLQSSEGPALGAAVTALAALENSRRLERNLEGTYPMDAAVRQLVQFQQAVPPCAAWVGVYQQAMSSLDF
ncbi:MAG: FGGY-family carbohydrate kinase, partial [Gemmataceae bacterium]